MIAKLEIFDYDLEYADCPWVKEANHVIFTTIIVWDHHSISIS
jgi:hypothetical protein